MSTLQVSNVWFESTGSQRIFATSNALIRISSNGGVQIPSGTTAGRPTNEAGILRYNTDTGLLEYGDSSSWLPIVTTLSPANSWANTVGTAGNNYATVMDTAGNNYASVLIANVAAAINANAAASYTAINNFSIVSETAGNNYMLATVTAANNWANTKLTNGTVTIAGTLTSSAIFVDSKGADIRDVPLLDKTSLSYTMTLADTGKMIVSSAGAIVYVPNAVFGSGNTIVVYNNSAGTLSVSPNSSVTLYKAGSNTTGSQTIQSYGMATMICIRANAFVISGTLA